MKEPSSELSPRKTQAVMMIFAFAIAILIGFAIFSLSRTTSSPFVPSLKEPVITDTLRHKLPDFNHDELGRLLTNLSGDGKWTLLTFWSVTCPPCMEELPLLNALSQSWQGPGFQIIAVNFDTENAEHLESAKQWLQENQIAIPTVYDKDMALRQAFQVHEYPKHFLISPSKEIVWQEVGAFNWNAADTREQLAKLMEARVPEPGEDPAE